MLPETVWLASKSPRTAIGIDPPSSAATKMLTGLTSQAQCTMLRSVEGRAEEHQYRGFAATLLRLTRTVNSLDWARGQRHADDQARRRTVRHETQATPCYADGPRESSEPRFSLRRVP